MVFFFYVFSLEFDFIVLKTSLMTYVCLPLVLSLVRWRRPHAGQGRVGYGQHKVSKVQWVFTSSSAYLNSAPLVSSVRPRRSNRNQQELLLNGWKGVEKNLFVLCVISCHQHETVKKWPLLWKFQLSNSEAQRFGTRTLILHLDRLSECPEVHLSLLENYKDQVYFGSPATTSSITLPIVRQREKWKRAACYSKYTALLF